MFTEKMKEITAIIAVIDRLELRIEKLRQERTQIVIDLKVILRDEYTNNKCEVL
jgi:hypothetical protein